MNKFLSLLLIFCSAVVAKAEISGDGMANDQRFAMLDKPLIMTLSVGPNFNTGGNKNAEWFFERPDVCTQIDWRMNFGFNRHWSVYADLGLSVYDLKTDSRVEDFFESMMDIFIPGISKVHPSISLGVSYLAQKGRWQFMPRIGVGNLQVKNSRKRSEANGVKHEVKREISPYFAEAGIGFGFRTSRVCSIVLDVNYRCPLESSTVTVKTEKDGQVEKNTYKSSSWGNDLSISLGIQFQTDMRRKKK